MKNTNENTILIIMAEVAAYVFLVLAALSSAIVNGAAISVAWSTLAALTILGGVIVAAVGYLFRAIDLRDKKAYNA